MGGDEAECLVGILRGKVDLQYKILFGYQVQ